MIATSSTVAPLMKTSSDSDFISYKLPNPCESCLGTITMLIGSLDNRVKTMNHDLIKLDILVCSALNVKPDMDRISRADGKEDARKD